MKPYQNRDSSGVVHNSSLGPGSYFVVSTSDEFSCAVYFVEPCLRVFKKGLVALFAQLPIARRVFMFQAGLVFSKDLVYLVGWDSDKDGRVLDSVMQPLLHDDKDILESMEDREDFPTWFSGLYPCDG